MAKVYTGRDGRLLLAGTTLVKVSTWSLQADVEVLETTTLGDYARSYTPGIQAFSGNATLLYYKNDAGVNDAATLLRKVVNTTGVETTDTVQLTLRLNDGDTNDDVTLTGYITSASFGASVGEVTSAQITFQATGALTTASLP